MKKCAWIAAALCGLFGCEGGPGGGPGGPTSDETDMDAKVYKLTVVSQAPDGEPTFQVRMISRREQLEMNARKQAAMEAALNGAKNSSNVSAQAQAFTNGDPSCSVNSFVTVRRWT